MNIPEGWKLVPVEPTEEMAIVLEDAYCDQLDARIGDPNRREWPSEDSQPLAGRLAYRAALAAAPTPPAQSLELEPFDAGSLPDYEEGGIEWWQEAIRNLLQVAHEHYQEQVEDLLMRPAQDEPVAWMDVHDNWDLYKNKPSQVDVVPLYTRPDNSGLRKAAKLFLTIIEEADEYMRSEGIFDLFYDPDEKKVLENLRTALEGK